MGPGMSNVGWLGCDDILDGGDEERLRLWWDEALEESWG